MNESREPNVQELLFSNSKSAEKWLAPYDEDLYGPPSQSPVITVGLEIEQIWYSKEDKDSGEGDDHKRSPLISMNQVMRLIDRLGTHLNSLTLQFISCMGVSRGLINAVRKIEDLKSLTIIYSYSDLKGGTYDPNSISDLLAAIPRLESLALHPSSIFHDLVAKPPALSNLRHLSSTYDDDLKGLSSITSYTKNTLKSIQLFPMSQDPGSLIEVLEPVKDTLEGLFTLSFTEQIKEDLTNLTFPNLRVIASQRCPGHLMEEIEWLNVPMLKNVRTIMTDLFASEESWLRALEFTRGNAFKSVPNIKHIILVGNPRDKHRGIDPQLAKDFKSNGVQSHLSLDSSWDGIMKLDYKLNRPRNM